jgi:AAA15 family ATPase/GTPase
MRPIAFQILDFKSIENSGICKLSGDGITVLAGQNEAGKTAVLTALRDFDLEESAAARPLLQA